MANENVKGEAESLEQCSVGDEIFYKISNVDDMPPFFMSIVSDSNHWMFISSNGGLSAGRKDADNALFPYYTDDKITGSAENTGSKSIFWVNKNNEQYLWEPFSERSEGKFNSTRNLYKNKFGNKIIFEEINLDLGLCFKYQWSSSNLYGFVRTSNLFNISEKEVSLKLLDGLQNILPFGVGGDLQLRTSNLADAYKRTELVPQSGLGIFALSAIIVDKAEPSEALKANIVWSLGFTDKTYLLSSLQLKSFRESGQVLQEEDVKGEKGSYFVVSDVKLAPNSNHQWMIAANVNQNHADIIELSNNIENDRDLLRKVLNDVTLGTENLVKLNAASDGLQYTDDGLKDARHFSNVLFNIMRGGIFDDNYQIEKTDFTNYLSFANKQTYLSVQPALEKLAENFSVFTLRTIIEEVNDANFNRLATQYLPLKFSRRHGDPSRPWNKFSINTRSEIDGSKILDYQGNWRDIFQNWEALAYSYPEFIEGMIYKFLNASTFDGYNPYRVTKEGFDWETIEPDDPWSYIGYWGDHQIIYLLKFFEFLEHQSPGYLLELMDKNGFVYANVPYKIKPYKDILLNPKDTIIFDNKNDSSIHKRMEKMGGDGALLTDSKGEIYQVDFCEKILATVLAKLSNFVPEGGIWMNTQRPEWNDANNALVGNGLSMVTLCYLRRFLKFFEQIFEKAASKEMAVSSEMFAIFDSLSKTFEQYQDILTGPITDTTRKEITDALGIAGSEFRTRIYEKGFSGDKTIITAKDILHCFSTANAFLEQSILINERKDHLYHTYNLISYDNHAVQVSHLSEMLEGQVAVLSSAFLSAEQSLNLLDGLKSSSLYRQDQNSYILYPNKQLPKFLLKNTIRKSAADSSSLFNKLLKDGNNSLVQRDIKGDLHFNGNFRNANDVKHALENLNPIYQELVNKEKELVLNIFEEVFCHKEFTGRSGTFYGYEGLGSIYWHMVSKLLLSVQESCLRAIADKADEAIVNRLVQHYYDINDGIGVHKPPHIYGAFPTDPYSHTPAGKGAQQPGMTGQVKEDILCRFGELGIVLNDGKLTFKPNLLRKNEFLQNNTKASFVLVNGNATTLNLAKHSLAFSICQVPVVYTISAADKVEVMYSNGTSEWLDSLALNKEVSAKIFHRTNEVAQINVFITEDYLR